MLVWLCHLRSRPLFFGLTVIAYLSAVPFSENPREHHISAFGSEIKRVQCPCVVDVAYNRLYDLWLSVFIFRDVSFGHSLQSHPGNFVYRSSFHHGWWYVAVV